MQFTLFKTYIFSVSILRAKPNHKRLKYRCPKRKGNCLRVIRLTIQQLSLAEKYHTYVRMCIFFSQQFATSKKIKINGFGVAQKHFILKYTKYYIKCHMIFYVNVVINFLMTFLMFYE